MPDRRRKPIYRPRNIVLLLLAVAVGWLAISARSAIRATPGNAVDYQQKLRELVESSQANLPAGPDAWPILVDAIERLNAVEAEVKAANGGPVDFLGQSPSDPTYILDYSSVRAAGISDRFRDSIVSAIDRHRERGLFDRLAEAAAAPRAIRPREGARILDDIVPPELGRMRQLARLGGARMFLAHQAGDTTERLAAFEQTLALGRIACQQPLMIDRLVGIAIGALALQELRSQLVATPPDAATARALLAALDRQAALLPPPSFMFEAERVAVLDIIQQMYTDDGRGDGRLLISQFAATQGAVDGSWTNQLPDHPIVNIAGILFPGKAQTVAKTNELFDGLVTLSSLPRSQRTAAFDLTAFFDNLPRGHVILRSMTGALKKYSLGIFDNFAADLAGTRLMLALEIFRAEHGDYPATLAQLTPAILPELPIDPYSGRPFGYRRVPPHEDPAGRGCLLYSVGGDGQDNGGAPAAGGNHTAFGAGAPGSDYILNTPRE